MLSGLLGSLLYFKPSSYACLPYGTGETILQELQQIKQQQVAQAAATAELLVEVSKTKQSITTAADVGVEVLRRSTVVPISDMLQHSHTEVPESLTAVRAQWEAGMEEKHLQVV